MGKSDTELDPGRGRPRLDRIAGRGRCRRRSRPSRPRPSPSGIPIVDRDTGRVLSVLAGGPAADRGGRHGLRLLDPLDGARPAGRRHDRDDRPGPVADRPGPRLVAAGRASPTSGSRSSTRPALDAFAADDPALAGPFDLAFIDALKPEYAALPRGARRRASRPARWSSPTTSCGAAASSGARPGRGRRRQHRRPCARSTRRSSPIRASRPRSCPLGDGLLVAALARLTVPRPPA